MSTDKPQVTWYDDADKNLMDNRFLVFGNHPKLSLAEFLAVRPESKVVAQAPKAIIASSPDWEDDVLMNLLGGTIKLGDIFLESQPEGIRLAEIAQRMVQGLTPTSSLEFGWTVYGADDKQKKIFRQFPIQIKNALKKLSWKPRWVSSQGNEPLTPAAVAKCHLTERPNADLCLIIDHDKAYLGRTTQVQDADAWSLRDYGRPCRDDENGMLPPKLARMMVNLAHVPDNGTLLDPFCGSGTVLMEAALATRADRIIGSDIQARQVGDAQANTDWLLKKNILRHDDMPRFKFMETDVKLIGQHLKPKSVDAMVTEGWLGPLLGGRETLGQIEKNTHAITRLWDGALRALRPVLKDKGLVVAVFPSFRHGKQIFSALTDLDYKTSGFALAPLPPGLEQDDLYYERVGQHLRRNIRILRAI